MIPYGNSADLVMTTQALTRRAPYYTASLGITEYYRNI